MRPPLRTATWLLLAVVAISSIDVSAAPPTRVARGTVAEFEIDHPAGPLRAKALRDGSSPILVRVSQLGGPRQRHLIECLGVVEGEFDLLPLLEQTDGRPPEGLEPIRVAIFSQLPPIPTTDLYGLPEPAIGLESRYRLALGAIALAWLAVPTVVVARRLFRRAPEPPPPPRPVPTALDRVRALLAEASTRSLDVAERGRFELLLLRGLREAAPGSADPAEATERLRRDPASAPTVRAVERWLHAVDGEGRRGEALDRVAGSIEGEPRP